MTENPNYDTVITINVFQNSHAIEAYKFTVNTLMFLSNKTTSSHLIHVFLIIGIGQE